jgi:hypothetical protein
MGPRAGLVKCGKSRLPPGFDPRTVKPVASHDVITEFNCIYHFPGVFYLTLDPPPQEVGGNSVGFSTVHV